MNRLTHVLDTKSFNYVPNWEFQGDALGYAGLAGLLFPDDMSKDDAVFNWTYSYVWEDTNKYEILILFASLIANWTDAELDEFLATFN